MGEGRPSECFGLVFMGLSFYLDLIAGIAGETVVCWISYVCLNALLLLLLLFARLYFVNDDRLFYRL